MSRPGQKRAITRTSAVRRTAPKSSSSVDVSVTKSQSLETGVNSNHRSWANCIAQGILGLELDPHGGGERAAQHLERVAEPHRERAAERLPVEHLELVAEAHAALGQVAQHLRIRIRDADETAAIARREVGKAARGGLVDDEVRGGD